MKNSCAFCKEALRDEVKPISIDVVFYALCGFHRPQKNSVVGGSGPGATIPVDVFFPVGKILHTVSYCERCYNNKLQAYSERAQMKDKASFKSSKRFTLLLSLVSIVLIMLRVIFAWDFLYVVIPFALIFFVIGILVTRYEKARMESSEYNLEITVQVMNEILDEAIRDIPVKFIEDFYNSIDLSNAKLQDLQFTKDDLLYDYAHFTVKNNGEYMNDLYVNRVDEVFENRTWYTRQYPAGYSLDGLRKHFRLQGGAPFCLNGHPEVISFNESNLHL